MRATYFLLIAVVVAAGLFSAFAMRSAQGKSARPMGEAGLTLMFRAPPAPAA